MSALATYMSPGDVRRSPLAPYMSPRCIYTARRARYKFSYAVHV
jgi:hypothetical protein